VSATGTRVTGEETKEERIQATCEEQGKLSTKIPLTSSSSIVVLLSVDSLTLEPSLFLLMMLRPGGRKRNKRRRRIKWLIRGHPPDSRSLCENQLTAANQLVNEKSQQMAR